MTGYTIYHRLNDERIEIVHVRDDRRKPLAPDDIQEQRGAGMLKSLAFAAVAVICQGTAVDAATRCSQKTASGTGPAEDVAKFQVYEGLLRSVEPEVWATWLAFKFPDSGPASPLGQALFVTAMVAYPRAMQILEARKQQAAAPAALQKPATSSMLDDLKDFDGPPKH